MFKVIGAAVVYGFAVYGFWKWTQKDQDQNHQQGSNEQLPNHR